MFVFHTYDMTDTLMVELGAYANRRGLKLVIAPTSWYNSGTTQVELWAPDTALGTVGMDIWDRALREGARRARSREWT